MATNNLAIEALLARRKAMPYTMVLLKRFSRTCSTFMLHSYAIFVNNNTTNIPQNFDLSNHAFY